MPLFACYSYYHNHWQRAAGAKSRNPHTWQQHNIASTHTTRFASIEVVVVDDDVVVVVHVREDTVCGGVSGDFWNI
jgi:hypothetical protein